MLGCLLVMLVCEAVAGDYTPIIKQPRVPNPYRETGTIQQCHNGVLGQVTYDTVLEYGSDSVIKLNHVKGIKKVDCDTDATNMWVYFDNTLNMQNFIDNIVTKTDYISGDAEFGCPVKHHNSSQGTFLLRHCLGGAYDTTNKVKLHTADAKYDEVYKTAAVNYQTVGTCDDEGTPSSSSRHCFGVNTKGSCNAAIEPINLFQDGPLTVTCVDCYIGFLAHYFVDVNIDGFKLNSLSGGYKDMEILGELSFDVLAQHSWSIGGDKLIQLIPDTAIIHFWTGAVPFALTIGVPVELIAEATFSASAEATFGTTFAYNIGDSYIQWTHSAGWVHVHPAPTGHWTMLPSHGSASFDAAAQFAVIPTLEVKLGRLFEYDLTLHPEVDFDVNGNTSAKLICAKATCDASLTSQAMLTINIPLLHSHAQTVWGPKTIWTSGTTDLAHKCWNATKKMAPLDTPRLPKEEVKKEVLVHPVMMPEAREVNVPPLPAGREYTRRTGEVTECNNGFLHRVRYDTTADQLSVKRLEHVKGLRDVQCDVDRTELVLNFKNQLDLAEFLKDIVFGHDFVAGGGSFGCLITSPEGFMLRRVINGKIDGNHITLHAIEARYDEVYQNANINYETVGVCDENGVQYAGEEVCIGLNTDKALGCKRAVEPINLIQNSLIDVTCTNCFVGYTTHVFADINIQGFRLNSFMGGFKNITMDSAFVLDMKATKSWTAGIDKIFDLLKTTQIIGFDVGAVPFGFSIAIPVEMIATVTVEAEAEAVIGALGHFELGDNYAGFTEGKWKRVVPHAVGKWTKIPFSAHADFTGNFVLAVVPTVEFKLGRLFEYDLTFRPEFDFNFNGHLYPPPAYVCGEATWKMDLTSQCTLDINILDSHATTVWGPTELWHANGTVLGHKCFNVTA